MLPPAMVSGVIGAVITGLTLPPLASAYSSSLTQPQREAERRAHGVAAQGARGQEETAAEARGDARPERLGPDSSLREYLGYLHGEDARSRWALEAARQVRTREADAASLLQRGGIGDLDRLWELDVAPTPSRCAADVYALQREVQRVDQSRSDYLSVAMDLERELPNMRWLVSAHCDLRDTLVTLEGSVKAVSDSPRMDEFAAALATLRPSP